MMYVLLCVTECAMLKSGDHRPHLVCAGLAAVMAINNAHNELNLASFGLLSLFFLLMSMKFHLLGRWQRWLTDLCGMTGIALFAWMWYQQHGPFA